MVRFYEFVEVHRQQFKRNYQVSSEDIIVKDPHYIVFIVGIPIIEHFQEFKFYWCLMLKPFLIPDYFDCNQLLKFMVEAFYCLAETARTQFFNHFPPVAKMILHDDVVVATFIIIPIVLWFSRAACNLDGLGLAAEVYLAVALYFNFFILGEQRCKFLICLSASHRQFFRYILFWALLALMQMLNLYFKLLLQCVYFLGLLFL